MAEPLQEEIVAAWTELPTGRLRGGLTSGYTTRRIERILQFAFAMIGLVIGGEAALRLPESDVGAGVRLVVIWVLFCALAVVVVMNILGRFARIACAVFAVMFPIGMVVLATLPAPRWEPAGGSWMFQLLSVPVLATCICFRVAVQIGWALALPWIYGIVELLRRGFAPDTRIDVIYAVSLVQIVALSLIALVWVFRRIAAGVDEARDAAAIEYARARDAEIDERERVEVTALMHDSVLAALLAASRAQTDREHQLAVTMAREALTRLANADSDVREGSDEPVPADTVRAELVAQAALVGVTLDVPSLGDDAGEVPGRVARALVLAATQAIANALQHAGGRDLAVSVASTDGELRVIVRDGGGGIDPKAIPADRLGIRASIFARMAAVDGDARIMSDGEGTVVRLAWPRREATP
ncbi:MAG: ATP-binding protein [Microbacterium sp.]